MVEWGPLVQQASQTGSAGPRPSIMVHLSIRGQSQGSDHSQGKGDLDQPCSLGCGVGKGGDGDFLPLMLCPAFLSLPRLCSLADLQPQGS